MGQQFGGRMSTSNASPLSHWLPLVEHLESRRFLSASGTASHPILHSLGSAPSQAAGPYHGKTSYDEDHPHQTDSKSSADISKSGDNESYNLHDGDKSYDQKGSEDLHQSGAS